MEILPKLKKALEKLKNHNHYNLSWYVIPDRDSKWKNRAKEIVGEEQFKAEYLCDCGDD